MLEGAFSKNARAGEIIVLEGDEVHYLYVVLSGAVQLFSRYRRQTTEFAVVERGRYLDAAAALMQTRRLTSARALRPTQILAIPIRNVQLALEKTAVPCVE